MLLAGDIGGTKTLLGLFAPTPDRPRAIETGEFVTLAYDGLEPIIREFLQAQSVEAKRIDAACFGVAGAVTEQVARLFANRWLLLAGWVHYLAFALFLGSWEARDARLHGIPHWLVLPCLLLTFLCGPAGWLLYMIVRAARGKTVAVA